MWNTRRYLEIVALQFWKPWCISCRRRASLSFPFWRYTDSMSWRIFHDYLKCAICHCWFPDYVNNIIYAYLNVYKEKRKRYEVAFDYSQLYYFVDIKSDVKTREIQFIIFNINQSWEIPVYYTVYVCHF